jgi:hypothetical protein
MPSVKPPVRVASGFFIRQWQTRGCIFLNGRKKKMHLTSRHSNSSQVDKELLLSSPTDS